MTLCSNIYSSVLSITQNFAQVSAGQCIVHHRSVREGIKQQRNLLVQTLITMLHGCDFLMQPRELYTKKSPYRFLQATVGSYQVPAQVHQPIPFHLWKDKIGQDDCAHPVAGHRGTESTLGAAASQQQIQAWDPTILPCFCRQPHTDSSEVSHHQLGNAMLLCSTSNFCILVHV